MNLTVHSAPQLRKAKQEVIKREFLSIAGARWIPRESLPKDHYFFSRENIASGKPEMTELTWLNWMVSVTARLLEVTIVVLTAILAQRVTRLLQPYLPSEWRRCQEDLRGIVEPRAAMHMRVTSLAYVGHRSQKEDTGSSILITSLPAA